MRWMKIVCAWCFALYLCGISKADSVPQTPMPNVQISDQPLEKVLGDIRDKVPSFHFAVFRKPGTAPDYPKLPAMSVDGITIEQFVQLISREYPGISINTIPGDKQPLYAINISGPTEGPGTNTIHGGFAAPLKAGDFSAEKPVVMVFRLDGIISNMKSAADPKKSMDDLLSLVQAALDETGGDAKNQPVLKLHQATETLVYRGPADKLTVLQQLFEALAPRVDKRVAQLNDQLAELRASNDRLQTTVDATRMDAEMLRKQMRELEMQLVAAKAELGQAQGQLNAATVGADSKSKDVRLQELMEKVEAMKKKMQGEDSKGPQFAKDQLTLSQLLQAYVGTQHEPPATQLSK